MAKRKKRLPPRNKDGTFRKRRARARGTTRPNPAVGDIVEIVYDPRDGDPRPFKHKAGDRGRLLPKGKPAKLYINPRTGKPSIRGEMRWVNGAGLIG